MANFKRQKAIISAIDWDVDHMRDRIGANYANIARSASTSTIDVSALGTGGLASGAVVGADGHVYFIPSTKDYVMKLHPDDDSIVHEELGNAVYTYSDGTVYDGSTQISMFDGDGYLNVGADGDCFVGGVLAPNGHIYCIPYNANYVMKIDTNYGSETYGKPSRIETEITETDAGASSKCWWGGTLAPNGKIYCAPYNAKWVLVIDTKTDTISYLGKDDTSYEFGETNVSVSTLMYKGAVLHPDGYIVFVPYNGQTVACINLKDESIKFAVRDIQSIGLSNANKWSGGVYDPTNDGIVFIPYKKGFSATWGIMYNSTFTIMEHTSYTALSDSQFEGGVLAPNGNIYMVPRNSDQAAVLSYSSDGASGLFGGTGMGMYMGGVLAPNGCIYCAPYNTGTILKISPSPSLNLNFGLSTILSPYLNKF